MGKFTPKAGFDGKSVNGTVVSSNKNGAILRNRSIPTNVKRPTNTPHRSSFQHAATRWTNMPSGDKTDWEALNLDGHSGYTAYQYYGNNRYICGQVLANAAPTLIGPTNWTASVSNPVSGEIVVMATRGVFVAIVNVVVYMSPPVLDGNQEPNNNQFRIVANISNPTSLNRNVRPEYESIFGPLDAYEDFVVFVRVVTITRETAEVNTLAITSLVLQNL